MELAPLLELAVAPALGGADQRIRPTSEGAITLDAFTFGARVRFAIGSPTLSVHAFPVPLAPVPYRLASAFAAVGSATEGHLRVRRKVLERKPPFAAGATLRFGHFNSEREKRCPASLIRGTLAGGLHYIASRWMTSPLPGVASSVQATLLDLLGGEDPSRNVEQVRSRGDNGIGELEASTAWNPTLSVLQVFAGLHLLGELGRFLLLSRLAKQASHRRQLSLA